MKSSSKFLTTLWLFAISFIAFSSCKKETTPPKMNRPPIANAGPDLSIMLPLDSVELRGSGSNGDGVIVSYRWRKLRGPVQYTLADSTAAVTKVDSLVQGEYEFMLTVKDDGGLSDLDIVMVTVYAPCTCAPNCDPWGDPCNPWDY
jgi:hypothetical protein